MDVYEAVMKRRSIRKFKDDPVPYDVLEKCVNAGRLAPSAKNRQLCEYIIVDNEQVVAKVFDNLTMWLGKPRSKGDPSPGQTPKAYVIILINSALEAEMDAPRELAHRDVGLAAENIMLVALEQGLGTCPIWSYQGDELKQILNVPASHDIALEIALGYPNESPVMEVSTGVVDPRIDDQGLRHVPKRKMEDIVHRNKFSK